MRVCFTPANCQAGVDEQDTTIGPWGQQTAPVWRRLVVRIVDLEGFVDVLERWWCWRWRANGETETVGLVGAMVGVLACDDNLDSIERRMSRPVRGC
jgi:hypothetical protein